MLAFDRSQCSDQTRNSNSCDHAGGHQISIGTDGRTYGTTTVTTTTVDELYGWDSL